MIKGVIFFIILFAIIFVIYYFYERINSVFRIDIVVKYLIIVLCVVGMVFPMFNNNLDNLSSKAGIYNFLTKKYTTSGIKSILKV